MCYVPKNEAKVTSSTFKTNNQTKMIGKDTRRSPALSEPSKRIFSPSPNINLHIFYLSLLVGYSKDMTASPRKRHTFHLELQVKYLIKIISK